MSAIASLFVAGRHKWLVYFLLWMTLFVVSIGAGLAILLSHVADQVRRDREAELSKIIETRQSVVSSLKKLNETVRGDECSAEVLSAMHRIAFLPDGLNSFMFAPGGRVLCSTSRSSFDPPVTLNSPDIEARKTGGLNLWVNRDLSRLTHFSSMGMIASVGNFAVVVPPRKTFERGASWLDREIVIASPDGNLWNVAGRRGLYSSMAGREPTNGVANWFGLSGITCDAESHHCMASKVHLDAWAKEWTAVLLLICVIAAAAAWLASSYIVEWLNRYWSFEARFTRHFENVVAYYQPIVDLRTGKVSGCEVLARWRDVDGTIVSPDRFLSIVEETGRTAEFTKLIAERAHEELCTNLGKGDQLQVNFNVFGCDLDIETLQPIFASFLERPGRFTVAVELLENQDVDFDYAQATIQELRQAGIKVYIDDFGIGYSSIERAATLAADGVKLDRTFAMAPPNSILERLLVQVLDMLKVSDREVVVEGIETIDRLNLLRASGNVDYAQGYCISRPLPIRDFATFVRTGWRAPSLKMTKLSVAG